VKPVRVLLVDDHQMLTEALAAELSAAPGLWVVGRCTTVDPGLARLVAQLRPDVITIELQPVGSAMHSMLCRLTTAWPAAHIVVLTASSEPARAADAARAGVDAWVPKDCSTRQLVDIVRGVCQGHASYPPECLGVVLRELRADVQRAREGAGELEVLSNRERDVLLGMIEGKRGAQIARELGVSANTVRNHTQRIFSKLKVHSRLEAVRVARSAGMRPGAADPGQCESLRCTHDRRPCPR
jgi:two-component system, NarL family, response regulator LiaR